MSSVAGNLIAALIYSIVILRQTSEGLATGEQIFDSCEWTRDGD